MLLVADQGFDFTVPDERVGVPARPSYDGFLAFSKNEGVEPKRSARTASSRFEKLVSLVHLSDGWDGYCAESPSVVAIVRAAGLLPKVPEDLPNVQIAPSGDGGAAIVFRNDAGGYADIEFLNSGETLAGITDKNEGKVQVWEFTSSPEESLERILSFASQA